MGTPIYVLLFNVGSSALPTPVGVDPEVRRLDWPFMSGAAGFAAALLCRWCVRRRSAIGRHDAPVSVGPRPPGADASSISDQAYILAALHRTSAHPGD